LGQLVQEVEELLFLSSAKVVHVGGEPAESKLISFFRQTVQFAFQADGKKGNVAVSLFLDQVFKNLFFFLYEAPRLLLLPHKPGFLSPTNKSCCGICIHVVNQTARPADRTTIPKLVSKPL
jgi:hypothetical protein